MRVSRKVAIGLSLLVIGAIWLWLRADSYPITNAQPSGRNIIAFGDSLTEGRGAPAGQGYPEQLSRRLGVPILNRGVSGDTTKHGLDRLQRDVLDHDPRIVLVELGGNDYLHKKNIDVVFGNLETIIGRIQQQGAMVILLGLETPLAGYGRRYRELAHQTGCPLVPDLMDGILARPSLMVDQIHPNAAGYGLVADKIEPVLLHYLPAGSTAEAQLR